MFDRSGFLWKWYLPFGIKGLISLIENRLKRKQNIFIYDDENVRQSMWISKLYL